MQVLSKLVSRPACMQFQHSDEDSCKYWQTAISYGSTSTAREPILWAQAMHSPVCQEQW